MLRPRLGSRASVALGVLVLSGFVLAIAVHKISFVRDIPRGDVIYDVTVARCLLRGEGFSTNLLPLGALEAAVTRGFGPADPWPSLHKFLFAQAFLAPIVGVMGPTVLAARVGSVAAYLVLACGVFGLLARSLRSVPAALFYALAFVTFDGLSSLAVLGVNACLDAVLFLAAVSAWLASLERPRLAPLAGALVGLLVLDRYSFSLLVPFFVAGVLWTSGRATAIRAALGVAVVLLPVITWSLLEYGLVWPSPLGAQLLIFRTKFLATDPWYTSAFERVSDHWAELPRALWQKALINLDLTLGMVAGSTVDGVRNLVLTGMAVLGALPFLTRKADPRRKVIVVLAAFSLVYAGTHLVLVVAYRYVVYLFPWIWVLACLFVHDWSRRVAAAGRAPRWLVAGGLVAAMIVPELARMRAGEVWVRANTTSCGQGSYCNAPEIVSFLRATYPTRGLVISGGNKPWELALDTDNRVTSLVERPEEVLRLRAAGVSVDLLLLPADLNFAGDDPSPKSWVLWDAVRDARVPSLAGLAFRHAFSDGSLLYERSALANLAVDYCALAAGIDLRRASARRYLGAGFRYTEGDGELGWAWLEGSTATFTLVGCAERHRLKLKLLAAAPESDVRVRVNGHDVATLRLALPNAWTELASSLPAGVLRDGANQIDLEVASQRPLSLALAAGALAAE